MGLILSIIKRKNIDDIFSYKTQKIVKVRDRRLGSVRTTLELVDKEKPNYEPSKLKDIDIQWLYWHTSQVVYPPGQEGSLFITTRVSERNIVFKDPTAIDDSECNPHLPTKRKCRATTSSLVNHYYVADVEEMTIMVEHTIRGNMFKITEVNKNLYGELLDSNNNVMWRYYPKNYKEKKYQLPNNENYTIREDGIPGDIFSVDTLLNAAGFNLDEINNENEPYRYSGCVIVVIIEYSNNRNLMEYKYKPTLILNAEMKILEQVTDVDYISPKIINKINVDNDINDSVGWMEYNRHGIEIKFVQSGKIGKFDLLTLCMNLVASIALLSVASTIVESLMLYILPERGIYKKFKFELTEIVSDIRHKRKDKKTDIKEDEPQITVKIDEME